VDDVCGLVVIVERPGEGMLSGPGDLAERIRSLDPRTRRAANATWLKIFRLSN
jgi:hypothetical protein